MNAWPQIRFENEASQEFAEQRQRESQRMEAIGRMVSGVAHDFNNLLTGIVLCSDLILAGLNKEDRLRKYAEEIRGAAAQGAGLIQLLSAVAQERSVASRELVFNDIILETRELLNRLIGANIELATDLAPDLRPVNLGPAQARQIVLNLVLNARDAIPHGGRIILSTTNCDTGVQFEVRDTGYGMDEPTRSRAFERFFTTKAGKGSGLGLATVLDIVRQGGGSVELESDVGKGTRVVVRLPAECGKQVRQARARDEEEQV